MTSAVLGKRNRTSAEGTDEPQTRATRSKRRVVLNEPNDENQNPFKPLRDDDTEEAAEVDDGGSEPAKKTRKLGTTGSVPGKHGTPGQRVPASPARVGAHFKVGKSAIQIFEDGKGDSHATPATPRHRNALSKRVPITPRHRVIVAGTKTTPRTPKTPSAPSTSTTAIYNRARQLFSRCSNPGKLIGRDAERNQLAGFIDAAVASHSGGCLYISGPPGTGKSALLQELLQDLPQTASVKHCTINCMSIKTTNDLSGKLSEDLDLDEGTGFDYLQTCFVQGKPWDTVKYLVVLDEVDRLVELDLELLYNLFAWSMQPSSRLILVGVANALDLTDRFLPRLKSRNLKPQLLHFMPYSAAQIAEVLTAKLKGLSEAAQIPFLHPTAIQFCAKKVAGQTGDLRKAFDICRRAIDLVDQETKEKDADLASQDSPSKTPLMENINLSSPQLPRLPAKQHAYTIDTAPKATIAHIAKVTAQVFGNGTVQRLATLNLQQKAVLCALAALEKRKQAAQMSRTIFATPSKHSNSAPSIKQLYDAYSSLCKRETVLHPLTNTEFRDVVSGLEALSLVSAVDGKSGSFVISITPSRTPGRKGKGGFGTAAVSDERRLASAVGGHELSGALEGSGGELLRDILEGDLLLS